MSVWCVRNVVYVCVCDTREVVLLVVIIEIQGARLISLGLKSAEGTKICIM